MNTLLNIAIYLLFFLWLWKHFVIRRKKLLIGIVGFYLLAAIVVFIFSFFAQNDYLDGVLYLIAGGFSIFAFWLSATVLVFWKNIKEKTTEMIFLHLLQLIPLILIPLLIWLLLSNANLKIGG